METPPILATWRTEITEELTVALAELAAAITDLGNADQAERNEQAEYNQLEVALARHDPRQSLAAALSTRYRHQQEKLRTAEGSHVRERNRVAGLRRRIADLQDAIEQLDRIAPLQEDPLEEVA